MGVELVDPETIAAAEQERGALARLERRLRAPAQETPRLLFGREEIPVPASLLRLLTLWVQSLEHGQPVTVVPGHRLLTTTEAADLLNVSRPYLLRLLDRGDIPYTRVGTHRRIAPPALFAYKARRDEARRERLREFSRLGQELDTEAAGALGAGR
jgi:excisionase family DNA binding protein